MCVLLFTALLVICHYSVTKEICKCACANRLIMCRTTMESEACKIQCVEQCWNRVHTVDDVGNCIDDTDCACTITVEHEPMCGKNLTDNKQKNFKNWRHLFCLNLCYDNIFEYEHDGYCNFPEDDRWVPLNSPTTHLPKEEYKKLKQKEKELMKAMKRNGTWKKLTTTTTERHVTMRRKKT